MFCACNVVGMSVESLVVVGKFVAEFIDSLVCQICHAN